MTFSFEVELYIYISSPSTNVFIRGLPAVTVLLAAVRQPANTDGRHHLD